MKTNLQIYEDVIREAKPIGAFFNHRTACLTMVHCVETTKQAREQAKEPILRFSDVAAEAYIDLSRREESYRYALDLASAEHKFRDFEYMDSHDYVVVGDRYVCIEKLRRYEETGVQEIVFKIYNCGHKNIINSFKLLGKSVLPEFRKGTTVQSARGANA